MTKTPRFKHDRDSRRYQKSDEWYLNKLKMVARPVSEAVWTHECSEVLWAWAKRRTSAERDHGAELAGFMWEIDKLLLISPALDLQDIFEIVAEDDKIGRSPLFFKRLWNEGANGEPLRNFPRMDWQIFLMPAYDSACRELLEIELARKSRTTAAIETAVRLLEQLNIQISARLLSELTNAIYDLFEDGWDSSYQHLVSTLIEDGCSSSGSPGETKSDAVALGEKGLSALVEHHENSVVFTEFRALDKEEIKEIYNRKK